MFSQSSALDQTRSHILQPISKSSTRCLNLSESVPRFKNLFQVEYRTINLYTTQVFKVIYTMQSQLASWPKQEDQIEFSQVMITRRRTVLRLEVRRKEESFIPFKLLQTHVPEQNTFINQTSKRILMVLLAIYPSLSPTLPNQTTKTIMSHPSHLSCIPIKQTTGNLVEDNFEVQGVNLFFQMIQCINFSAFNRIVECAWKATAYSDLIIPSNTPSKSLHTCMGISFQLPKKTQAALEKIKNKFYENHPIRKQMGCKICE
ncbi:hypothetical protein VP01_786g4 [Puccinia sorghi]|uniref:Uncharacterized protein n=1 Tax=Puccinia sorghi TaxID=27349 RepID=A0A0L6UAX2_9BASI|nr:hypothetical protein VP01_786g4 [Puccinia sorghi]